MKPEEAESTLKEMLIAAGFDFETPDPRLAWNVFKEFAHRPVEGVVTEKEITGEPIDGVMNNFLWQLGCFDFTGEKLFYLDFVSQFYFLKGGEFHHIEQLHIEFTCQPSPELLNLERNKWSSSYPTLTAYFADVETFPEFRAALQVTSWKVVLCQERV